MFTPDREPQDLKNHLAAGVAKVVCATLIGLIALFLVVLSYALINGDFWSEGRLLLSMPWGIMALVDLYIGFVIFAGFIFVSEPNKPISIVWISLLMVFGNLVAAIYLLRWLGKHWSGQLNRAML